MKKTARDIISLTNMAKLESIIIIQHNIMVINLQLIDRKVKSDTASDRVTVFQIPEEAHSYVEAGDNHHGSVEDPIPTLP